MASNQEFIKKQDYTVLEDLGSGIHGFVMKLLSKKDHQVYACKVINTPGFLLKATINDYAPPRIDSDLFVKYFVAFSDEKYNDNYFVMEYCEGGSATDFMRVLRRPMNEREINAVVFFALEALNILHSQKLVHNDIKAGNFILTTSGQLKISDTCVVNNLIELNMRSGHKDTKPLWRPPEFFAGSDFSSSAKSDIWALGIAMIEMIQMTPPNYKAGYTELEVLLTTTKEPEAPSDSSKLFKKFVSKVLVAEPSQRPDAAELLNDPFVKQINREQATDIIQTMAKRMVMYKKEKAIDDYEEEEEYEEEEDLDYMGLTKYKDVDFEIIYT